MKNCAKCNTWKSLSEFSKCASTKDGLQRQCKACANAYNSAIYALNKEQRKASFSTYYAENRERKRSYNATYNAENMDSIRASKAIYRAANPEKCRIHRHNRRARKAAVGGELSPGLAEKLFKLQKGKCACCKQQLGNDYHRDHIMPLALGGTNTDDNIQLLRPKCNNLKRARHPVDFMQQRGFLL